MVLKTKITGRLLKGALLASLVAGAAGLAEAKDVTLRMSTWLPARHHLPANTLPPWFEAINKATNGSIKIVIDKAPIAKPPAQYDVVRKGAADLSYHVMAYTPGPFEIVRGVELPFISPNAEIGSQAAWDWYDRNIGFDKEFKDVKVLTLMVHGPGLVHTRMLVKTLEDLKNVKLRVGGGGVRIAEALGATPVAMSAPKAYEAIQKGVTDGAFFPYEAVAGFKLFELTKFHLEIPGGLYTTPFAIVMNKKKWDSLSADQKAVLAEWGGVKGAKMLGAGWDRADVVGKKKGLDNGATVNVLSEAEQAKWAKKIAFMEDVWIKKANKAGYDGRALLKDLKATVKKFE
jgi:TRAP-type C4-dicarboxylate transport system substrate-binding protein